MADKHSSIILTVDLSCGKCHDKIKKVLSKYEDRWDIRSVVWDEKNNKITLTGPFCPRKLSKKLCKKACKVIKSYDIPDLCECDEEKPKPQPAAPAEPKKVDPPKPAPAKPPEPKKVDPPKPENPKPAPPAPPPKADKPAPSPPQPAPAAVPDPYPPVWPVCFGGPWCQCGAGGGGYPPWGCNCSCGCGHGGGGHGCGRPCHASCKVEFFCEEDSSCRPM